MSCGREGGNTSARPRGERCRRQQDLKRGKVFVGSIQSAKIALYGGAKQVKAEQKPLLSSEDVHDQQRHCLHLRARAKMRVSESESGGREGGSLRGEGTGGRGGVMEEGTEEGKERDRGSARAPTINILKRTKTLKLGLFDILDGHKVSRDKGQLFIWFFNLKDRACTEI